MRSATLPQQVCRPRWCSTHRRKAFKPTHLLGTHGSAYPLIYTIMCVLPEDEGYTRTDTCTQVRYFSVQTFPCAKHRFHRIIPRFLTRSCHHMCFHTMDSVASLGSRHWERDGWERQQGKGCWESYCYGNNVISLQINTAGIMAMNRMDRIVLDPIRTYACTRTARTGVRVTVPLSL